MALSLYMQYDSEWSPPCDVCESEQNIQLIADLPGLSRDSLRVGIEDGLLVISGERARRGQFVDGGRYHAAERGQGKFKKLLTLPKGLKLDELDYQLTEGLLLVTIPKRS
jgi:HSP20 family protein